MHIYTHTRTTPKKKYLTRPPTNKQKDNNQIC